MNKARFLPGFAFMELLLLGQSRRRPLYEKWPVPNADQPWVTRGVERLLSQTSYVDIVPEAELASGWKQPFAV